jgi:hypothetical protein
MPYWDNARSGEAGLKAVEDDGFFFAGSGRLGASRNQRGRGAGLRVECEEGCCAEGRPSRAGSWR